MMKKPSLQEILSRLAKAYPGAKTALEFSNPLELIIATVLSAQSTDKQINKLTPALFQKYKTPKDYADAPRAEVEEMVRSSGFYKNKAKNIQNLCRELIEKFDGIVPKTMDELVTLPGVGRKTANVVLSEAYGILAGVCVDTHVARVSQRLKLTRHADPVKIERDLMEAAKQKDWKKVTNLLITHGRQTCFARKPNCSECVLWDLCPSREI